MTAEREADELENSLKEFAGHPARWCKEWFRVFQRTQGEAYIPALIAAYEQQCREKFDAPTLAEANAEIRQLKSDMVDIDMEITVEKEKRFAAEAELSRLRGEREK